MKCKACLKVDQRVLHRLERLRRLVQLADLVAVQLLLDDVRQARVADDARQRQEHLVLDALQLI